MCVCVCVCVCVVYLCVSKPRSQKALWQPSLSLRSLAVGESRCHAERLFPLPYGETYLAGVEVFSQLLCEWAWEQIPQLPPVQPQMTTVPADSLIPAHERSWVRLTPDKPLPDS